MINFGEYSDRPFSEMFHVSLRKGVDSRYSSLSWNYMHICDADVMVNFCGYVDRRLKEADADKLTGELLAQICKNWSWEQRKPDSHFPLFTDEAHTHAIVLHGIMEFMPKEDYDGIANFMNSCIEFSLES